MNDWGRVRPTLAVAALIFLVGCGGGGAGRPAGITGGPAVTPSAANLDFGAQRVGTSGSLTLTITDSGSAALAISKIAIGGTGAAAFAVSNNTCGSSVAAGSSCTVQATFTPAKGGSVAATLNITDNGSDSPQIVGLSGDGSTISGLAHGMFILDPPGNDNNCTGLPANCYSQHLVPTLICTGAGTPAGYGCTQAGAGEPFIEGAIFYVRWDQINPSNGSYDFTIPDNRSRPWSDSGKLVGFDFIPTTQGSTNDVTPAWYMTPVSIARVSQTGGIITLQSSTDMGFFPGGVSAAAGLEIQIAGTGTALDGNSTATNPGIWTVCDHTTAGCQDPSARTIYAIGSGNDIAVVSAGTVGNPVYGSAGGPCGSGILPIEWRPNFIKAWQAVIQQVVAHYGQNNNVAYLRFGLGIGGENIPNHGTNVTACQTQMTTFGFTAVAAPWPDPSSS